MVAANDFLIKEAVENHEFPKRIEVAVDTHNVYRHSKLGMDINNRKRKCTDIQTVVGTQPKNGTSYAHKYMTIQNIKLEKQDPSYVIAFDRMYFGKNDIAKTAEKILVETETKIKSEIFLFLGDGGFDDIDTMKMLNRRKNSFIVRADQDKKVKEIIKKARMDGKNFHIEYGYLKGTEKNGVKVNLVIVSVEWLREFGIKYPLVKKQDRYLSWFTNLEPSNGQTEMIFCIGIAKKYKKRWGIETGYRDIGDFQAKTHSLSDSVRLFLYLQAILLYNLWIQVNYMFKDDPDRIRHFRDGIPKSMIKFIIEQILIKGEHDEVEEGPLIK
jgi:hypothetical protein